MKKIKYVGIILSIMFMISYSCNKEEVIEDVEIEYTKLSEEEINEHKTTFNNLFLTKADYYDFKTNIFNEGKSTFSSLENIKEVYKDVSDPDFSTINIYLQMKGSPAINTEKFEKEGFDLIKDSNTSFDDFSNYLMKYDIYSKTQIDLVKNYHNSVELITNKEDYNKNLEDFESIIYSASLPTFEKNTLLIYTSLVQFYNPEWVLNNDNSNKTNTCKKCIKKHAWKIFGFSALWAVAAAIVCFLFGGPILAIICLLGFFGAALLGMIRGFCRLCF